MVQAAYWVRDGLCGSCDEGVAGVCLSWGVACTAEGLHMAGVLGPYRACSLVWRAAPG